MGRRRLSIKVQTREDEEHLDLLELGLLDSLQPPFEATIDINKGRAEAVRAGNQPSWRQVEFQSQPEEMERRKGPPEDNTSGLLPKVVFWVFYCPGPCYQPVSTKVSVEGDLVK